MSDTTSAAHDAMVASGRRPRRCRPATLASSLGILVTVPADHPVIHMTAAFAREQDARFALGILTSSAGHVLSSAIRPVEESGGRVDVILLEVEIEDLDAERVTTAMTGAHGVVLPEPGPPPPPVSAAA